MTRVTTPTSVIRSEQGDVTPLRHLHRFDRIAEPTLFVPVAVTRLM